MKFVYQYRTPDNKSHKGMIRAVSRDAAYAALKAQGIKPGRVEDAPGVFNKLFGRGKRWIAILVLGALCLVLGASLMRTRHEAQGTNGPDTLDRAQLYGDPVVIAECVDAGWTNVFSSALDVYLAKFAVPGQAVSSDLVPPVQQAGDLGMVSIADGDLAEIVQMKRMVNGIKQEMAEYLADGGSRAMYFRRLMIRQRAEQGFVNTAVRQIRASKDHAFWRRKNAELRAMGLPMVATEEP